MGAGGEGVGRETGLTMIDLLAFVGSIALVGSYQLFLRSRLAKDPLYTVHGVNKATRAAWVNTVMANARSDVLAVQTLRNSVMASSFMASTAILLLIGTLTLAGQGEHESSLWHALNVSGDTTSGIITLKLICLLLDFFVAFFCFSMAVRFYNHVGYMIVTPAESADAISPGMVVAYLDRAGVFYLLGIRSFFYSVPLVFWMFGPYFMMASTLGLIAALYPLDRAPRATVSRVESRSKIATPGKD
jgi:uncharacterized membrane protein